MQGIRIYDVVGITTTQLHSAKPELKLFPCSNSAGSVLAIHD